jgi:hypothetical protein
METRWAGIVDSRLENPARRLSDAQPGGLMSTAQTFLALAIVGAAFPSTARASCASPVPFTHLGVTGFGTQSFAGAAVAPPPAIEPQISQRHDHTVSIVGLWHVRFLRDGQPFDEAFDAWESGGTEVLDRSRGVSVDHAVHALSLPST